MHLWKMENICCTRRDGDSDNEDDVDDSMKDEGNDAEAMIEERFFYHPGAVNRIRSCPQAPNVIATWADTGKVHLFDAAEHIDALDRPPTKVLSVSVLCRHLCFPFHLISGLFSKSLFFLNGNFFIFCKRDIVSTI